MLQEYQELITSLEGYIMTRQAEFSHDKRQKMTMLFHAFGPRVGSRADDKIDAANALITMIKNLKNDESLRDVVIGWLPSPAEKRALLNGRLGGLIPISIKKYIKQTMAMDNVQKFGR